MPCDPKLQTYDATELSETLSEIENIIKSVPEPEILWSGDLNLELSRDNNFTIISNDFY